LKFRGSHSTVLENLEEVDKLRDAHDLPKLNKENINYLNRSIMHNGIKVAMNSLPTKKSPGPEGFSAESISSEIRNKT
jgi:hypothetical protein